MRPAYIGLLVFVWILASIMGAVIDAGAIGDTSTATDLNNVLGWTSYRSTEFTTPYTFVGFLPVFFGSLFKLLTFDFSFLQDEWELARWIILSPIIAIFVFGITTMFIGFFQRQF